VRHLLYLGVLVACLIGTLPLEFLLHLRVYARWRRVAGSVLPVVILFGSWDLWAVATHTWRYERGYLTGIFLPGGLPVEELLFFVVIPLCAILTLEAVRARRPHWRIGDEGGTTA
jgi:lycopene cyclase domain-containing protein